MSFRAIQNFYSVDKKKFNRVFPPWKFFIIQTIIFQKMFSKFEKKNSCDDNISNLCKRRIMRQSCIC